MTHPKLLWALAALQAVALPGMGCWYVCNESTERAEDTLDVEAEADGRLFITGYYAKGYANCEDLCREEPGLVEFKHCAVRATPKDAAPPANGRSLVAVTCSGIWASCKSVPSIGSGRAPEHYVPPRAGAWLAELAYMESAAAVAFCRLAQELESHGAPPRLIAQAVRAAKDEARHYALMRKVAARFGETAEDYSSSDLPTRSLLDIAIENAREGVVHETFGALVNAYQAEYAEDDELRAVFATILRDEVMHARLSLEVHGWLLTQLGARERLRVEQEARLAIARLFVDVPVSQVRAKELGTPSRDTAKQILHTLAETVWNACAA